MNSDTHRFTDGSILTGLIKFAIPFLIANFLVSMYGAVDVFIINYYTDSATLSAVATGTQVVFTIMAIINGLELGGTILIGQYFGAKKQKDVLETIGTELILFAWFSVVCAILMLALADDIVAWMKTPIQARQATINYIRICGAGLLFSSMYEAISSILRGLGDSKNPLKFIAVACVINALLDVLFVGYFHWGASGAAVATAIAQALSFIISVIYLKTHKFMFDFKRKSFQFISQKAKMILKLGIPTAIQNGILYLSFTITVISINKLGVVVSAALSITDRIESFMLLPAIAFGSAISVVVAQNMGANKINRAKESFYIGYLLSLLFAIPSFLLMFVWPEKLIRLISSNPEYIETGAQFMHVYSPACLFVVIVCSVNGLLVGSGRTTFVMINDIIASVIFRIPLILMATGLIEIGLALPLATLPRAILPLCYFVSGRWKRPLLIKKTQPNRFNSYSKSQE